MPDELKIVVDTREQKPYRFAGDDPPVNVGRGSQGLLLARDYVCADDRIELPYALEKRLSRLEAACLAGGDSVTQLLCTEFFHR